MTSARIFAFWGRLTRCTCWAPIGEKGHLSNPMPNLNTYTIFTDGSCWSQVLSAFRTGAARGTKQIMENLEMQILEALSTEDWTETLQVAKAVGKNSKSHWVLDRRWLWFQKQMTRFWIPKMLTLKNSCIWIVLRQDHPVARQKKTPLEIIPFRRITVMHSILVRNLQPRRSESNSL